MNRERLSQGIATLGLTASDTQLQALTEYVGLLVKWNKTINLISRRDIARVVDRHILDSLSGLPYIHQGPVLDVGSGAGLPGIPLAIMAPQLQFVLCERMARRCRFLHQVKTELQLDNVQIESVNVADLAGTEYGTVMARAVMAAPELWAAVAGQVSAQGSMLVYAATTDTEMQESLQQLQTWADTAGVSVQAHQVSIPGLAHAHSIYQVTRACAG